MTDLTSYKNIKTAFLVKIEIPNNPTLLMTDGETEITYNSEVYNALGQFLSITETVSELRLNSTEITVSISAIPITSITNFRAMPIRGSKVTVYRHVTNTLGTMVYATVGKFKGVVNTYSINESIEGLAETMVVDLICRSQVGMLAGRYAGRRTNPADQNLYFPNDRSMDRVPSLANAKIAFGGV